MQRPLIALALLMLSLLLACSDSKSDSSTAAEATIDAAILRLDATPTVGATLAAADPPSGAPPSYALAKVRNWEYAVQSSPTVVASLQAVSWLADGLQGVDEFNAAERLVNIGISAPETLNVLLQSHTVSEYLSPLDLPALLSLQRMAHDRPQQLAQLTAAGWFRDGLTDAEAAIIAALYESSLFLSPEFDEIVANPEAALTVAMSTATNRAGETLPIAVLRSGPAPSDSPVTLVAQMAVPFFERMFDAPFPTPAVIIHVTPYIAGANVGANHQTHITLKPEIDANENPDFSVHAVFHEIAHYYLYAHPIWFAEGGADFAASYARHALTGSPIAATNSPCSEADSISELEPLLPDDSRYAGANTDPSLWQCNYALGERLMLAMYNELGEEKFLQGWRDLYGILAKAPEYPAQRNFAEPELRAAWLIAAGPTRQPALEHIWGQWYRGEAGFAVEDAPDSSPANPDLTAVNGRIDRAYVALTPNGPPVSAFSAGDVSGWAYLTLEYSQQVGISAVALTLDIIEHYEDGFPYSRRKVAINLQPQHSGGTHWVSLGPSPGQRWAVGRYWAYVYESGRKVAEVAFEVTP